MKNTKTNAIMMFVSFLLYVACGLYYVFTGSVFGMVCLTLCAAISGYQFCKQIKSW